MTEFLREELRKAVRDGLRKPLVICGAGVSTQATDGLAPSWASLIKSGITRVADLDANARKWANESRQTLITGNTATWITVADDVTERLGGPHNAEFATWLPGEVGQLSPARNDLLDAIFALHCPIATTNYDDILEKASGLQPIGWDDHVGTHQFLEGKRPGILHLHGHWRSPARVVLGSKSYGEHSVDKRRELLQEIASLNRSTIFIGCSQDGIADPDFSRLDSFLTEWQDIAPRRYWLIRMEKDENGEPKQPPSPDHTRRLFPLVFGQEYEQLPPLLRSLAPPLPISPPSVGDPDVTIRCIDRHEPKPELFGRKSEIETIVAALLASRAVIVGGAPGIGKTAVATAALYEPRIIAKYGRRRVFVSLESATEPRAILGKLVDSLGLPAMGDEVSLQRILEASAAERPIAAILDNAETVFEANRNEAERLLALAAQVTGLALVITTRGIPPYIPGAIAIGELPKLAAEPARESFIAFAGRHFDSDPDLAPLLRALDGHALSIRLVAAQAAGSVALKGLRESWDEVHDEILRRPGEEETRLTSVRVSLSISIKSRRMQSTPLARRLMAILAFLPGGRGEADVRSLLGERGRLTKTKVNETITCLHQLALVERRPDFRLRMLNPLRECAKGEVPLVNEDRRRLFARYIALSVKAGQIGRKEWDEVREEVEPEVDNLDSICMLAIETNTSHQQLDRALIGLATLYEFSGRGGVESLRAVTARARSDAPSALQAHCLYKLGTIAARRSNDQMARRLLGEARSEFMRIGNVRDEANCVHFLGQIMLARSHLEEAGVHLEESLQLYRRIGSERGEAHCINALGEIARKRSNDEIATTYFEQALQLYRRVGDVLGEANCISDRARVAAARDNCAEARADLEKALLLYRQVDARIAEAHCTLILGEVFLQEREYEKARATFEEALSIYRSFGDVAGEANCLYSLAEIEVRSISHAPLTALSYLDDALSLYRKSGYELAMSLAWVRKGQALQQSGDTDRGRADIESGFALFFRIADAKDRALAGWHAVRTALLSDRPYEGAKSREMARSAWVGVNRYDLISAWLN